MGELVKLPQPYIDTVTIFIIEAAATEIEERTAAHNLYIKAHNLQAAAKALSEYAEGNRQNVRRVYKRQEV